jgi:flagellin-specific chaperone FliS
VVDNVLSQNYGVQLEYEQVINQLSCHKRLFDNACSGHDWETVEKEAGIISNLSYLLNYLKNVRL